MVSSAIVLLSLDRGTYHFYLHDDPTKWQHPTAGVVAAATLALGEALVLSMVLASSYLPRLWQRSLGALTLLIPFALFCSTFVIHAPGFWLVHLLWLWLVTIAVGVALGLSAIQALFSRWRQAWAQ